MNIAELNHLETQVDTLISNLIQLQSENNQLQQRLGALTRERNSLQEANQTASNMIKRLIGQLKEDTK